MNDIVNGVHSYLLCGDFRNTNISALEQYITDSVDILAYWNHIPLVYVIKTRLHARQIAPKFQSYFQDCTYLLVEINSSNSEGVLPPSAWHWFSTPAPKFKHQDTAISSLAAAYAGLLDRDKDTL